MNSGLRAGSSTGALADAGHVALALASTLTGTGALTITHAVTMEDLVAAAVGEVTGQILRYDLRAGLRSGLGRGLHTHLEVVLDTDLGDALTERLRGRDLGAERDTELVLLGSGVVPAECGLDVALADEALAVRVDGGGVGGGGGRDQGDSRDRGARADLGGDLGGAVHLVACFLVMVDARLLRCT